MFSIIILSEKPVFEEVSNIAYDRIVCVIAAQQFFIETYTSNHIYHITMSENVQAMRQQHHDFSIPLPVFNSMTHQCIFQKFILQNLFFIKLVSDMIIIYWRIIVSIVNKIIAECVYTFEFETVVELLNIHC